MKKIPLSRGLFAIVDDADYQELSQYKWYATASNAKHVYAIRNARRGDERCSLRMHRVIINALPHQLVDHVDGNTLNNTKANLRLCSKRQNAQNAGKKTYRNKTTNSMYKGVSYCRAKPRGKSVNRAKPWVAQTNDGEKRVYLGYFSTEEEAARAYDSYAIENYGEFAKLNFHKTVSK